MVALKQISHVMMALVAVISAAPVQDERSPAGDHFWQSAQLHPSFIDFSRRHFNPFAATQCNLQDAKMPSAPTALPSPAAGLTLSHVAIGRGTQNYTCDTTNSTAVPVAVGAVASLYNVSCIAVDAPALLEKLPSIALNLPVPCTSNHNSAAYKDMSGHHYFTDATTPYFNLDTTTHQYGQGAFKKANATAAPNGAAVGQDGQGNGAVPWLKLDAKSSLKIQEVYRLNTAGGQPPKTCAGQAASFEIQYAAEYWFWSN